MTAVQLISNWFTIIYLNEVVIMSSGYSVVNIVVVVQENKPLILKNINKIDLFLVADF